ncbi:phosphoinositide 3-kinase regulatory subunit 4 isoform X2 [Zootermopsis nevadensis]|uniref:non-specific serine/threonine protein kinase n=1 Tax=Zootermopsis nevadensis TaxID=136037 RepID=A0A067QVH4_ZOONE|nr:phosphoinositide 3-kinase regulatory subunit 4 isoform X2 [Zootermopsis nevadensis]KDR14050.1 Phosphoinositide 3-kinase regulatory subunit 4 [Zootermopsis nevadensis]
MGNQLVGIAPSQIFPVEHYLTDHADLQFDVNLGSTRFLKVARARTQEGLIVVKVFAIHDPTLPLTPHKEKVEEIRKKLASAVNCLPFQRAVLTEKAGFIMREYVKYSLYDRISTRPFLTDVEKRWIAFQVLYALHQCHKVGVCHGDIKLENILITSWNWVLLADFASFKPTYLPEDNPGDYSYFFDASRRRTCYIAPERFIQTLNPDGSSQVLLPEESLRKGDLTPAMDIFSAGCALTELFNEVHDAPFDLSELLAYCSSEDNDFKHLDNLEDPDIRELIRNMSERDPACRQSAEAYLAQERKRVFPEYFYSFLQSYMHMFSAPPIISPDEKISRLRNDMQNIIQIVSSDTSKKKGSVGNGDGEKKECKEDGEHGEKTEADGLVIITALVTSCIRGLHYCTSKLQCLDMLLELAAHTSSETILDRILPYVMHLVHDPFPRVRVRAIHTLTSCLELVKSVPCSDANIFPEYVLPGLAAVTTDEAMVVRAAYAENISRLAKTAMRYLDQCHPKMQVTDHGGGPPPSYESELQTLHEMIQQAVAMLLTDPCNLVKQTLVENGITELCVFFGKQKANDVLLSHMITFLNDKEDKQLRASFFKCIIGVTAYVGWHSSSILTPLLQQGLTDPEEFVVVKVIEAMTSLTASGLLQKLSLYDLLRDVACYLVHPNLWIRQAVVGFLSSMARVLDLVDVQCKVMVAIQPYLRHQVIQAYREELLLNALVPHIPRVVFDSVIRCSDIDSLLETLEERQRARGLVDAGHVPQNFDPHPALKNLFRRLSSQGMTDFVEEQLLSMSWHIKKIHRHRIGSDTNKAANRMPDGKIDLLSLKVPVPCHSIVLQPLSKPDNMASLIHARKVQRTRRSVVASDSHLTTMNEEWQHMFGGTPESHSQHRLSDTGSMSPPNGTSAVGDIYASPQHSIDTDHTSLHERSYIEYRSAPCRSELQELSRRKQELHTVAVRGREWAEQVAWRSPMPPPSWRLRGSLVAHLHEHRGAISRLVAIPETPLFASSASDGCIRVWDCGKMEGRNIANRSRQVFNRQAGPLVGLAVCENNLSLASASLSGSVFVLRIEANSNKMSVLQSRQLDLQEDGFAVDINYLDAGAQSVLVYATMYGSIVGWDLRSPGTAWKLDSDLKRGLITSFCLDPHQSWLAVGTSSGFHICWDLRFQLPISTIDHPVSGTRIRRLICHPTEQSCVMSAVHGNNEVSVWNLETHCRQTVLWASSSPPLTHTTTNSHSVCAMYASSTDQSPFLLTGGTDMRLRYWDLDTPSDSYLAVPAANDSLGSTSVAYKSRVIDGTNVIFEVPVKPRAGQGSNIRGGEESPRPGPDQPQAGHHDWISEIALCQASQCFLLSGSRDGVIKVWK